MTKKSKIVFFGTEYFSLQSLKELHASGLFSIEYVITKPDTKRGRGQRLSSSKIKQYAEQNNIKVLQPEKLAEITENIKEIQPVCGALVSFGKIIPQSIIDLFSPGIINLHPSLLPKYRGPSPIESAIANGDSEAGVSIMSLSSRMDAGPVYRQSKYPLTGKETQGYLHKTLSIIGAKELTSILPEIINNEVKPTEQDESAATYCPLLSKKDSLIATDGVSAITSEAAERLVRAWSTFPKARFKLNGKEFITTKASVASSAKTALDIKCQDGKFLIIEEIQAPGKKSMSTQTFLNGNKI